MSRKSISTVLLIASSLAPLVLLTLSRPAHGHEDHAPGLEEIVVYGRAEQTLGVARSASEGLVGFDDIRLPPLLRTGELAEAVPGLVATQHSGTGKANQFFLRGFNLDHGTDFSGSVDGVPVNLPTHGHGQGYLDLNFMIPELVAETRYRKGPYSAEVGDFSSAGSVAFRYYDRLPQDQIALTLGEFGFQRLLAAGTTDLAQDQALTLAADFSRYDGPWEQDEDLRSRKLYLGYTRPLGDGQLKVTLQDYHSRWDSTDQIPARAVRNGLISRLGNLDPDLGGETTRQALTLALERNSWQLSAWALRYDFQLFSNFTYFLEDPVTGDEFEQRDERDSYGLKVGGGLDGNFADRPLTIRWGSGARLEDIGELGLYRTGARAREGVVRQDDAQLLALDAFVAADWMPLDRLRATLGLRVDHQRFDADAGIAANSGRGQDTQLSPKLSLAWRLSDRMESYFNYGRGMHSNDVRGAVIRVDPASGNSAERTPLLVASDGAEIGLRFEAGERFNATAAVFHLALDSELLFVGDAGATEVNPGSERTGFEAVMFWQPTTWLAVNAAYTRTHARFDAVPSNEDRIPGAIEDTFALGLNSTWRNGLNASLRLRYLGEAPLTEDNDVRAPASTLVNAGVSYRRARFEVRLEAFNLLDSEDDDISYFYASRLPGEPAAGVEDVHFHPLEPRSLRASIAYRW